MHVESEHIRDEYTYVYLCRYVFMYVCVIYTHTYIRMRCEKRREIGGCGRIIDRTRIERREKNDSSRIVLTSELIPKRFRSDHGEIIEQDL